MAKCSTLPALTRCQNKKIFDVTKLKASADEIVAKIMMSLFDLVENTVGKRENAGYHSFILFPQCFPKPSSMVSLTSSPAMTPFEALGKQAF